MVKPTPMSAAAALFSSGTASTERPRGGLASMAEPAPLAEVFAAEMRDRRMSKLAELSEKLAAAVEARSVARTTHLKPSTERRLVQRALAEKKTVSEVMAELLERHA